MAYKVEFETGTAIPTLQNTFDSGMREGEGEGEGEESGLPEGSCRR